MSATTPAPLSSRAILEKLVAFPTVSRDTNLPLVDWVQGYLSSQGIDSHRVMSPCGTKAHLYAPVRRICGSLTVLLHHPKTMADGRYALAQ